MLWGKKVEELQRRLRSVVEAPAETEMVARPPGSYKSITAGLYVDEQEKRRESITGFGCGGR